MSELLDRIERLNEIGIALSAESDTPKLLELIMMGAKSLTHADGGSLDFLRQGELSFEIISNDSLDLQMGCTTGNEITFPNIPLVAGGGSIDPAPADIGAAGFIRVLRANDSVGDR